MWRRDDDVASQGRAATSRSQQQSPAATLNGAVAKCARDELVERAQRGDTAAFTELFRNHRSSVAAIVYRMMGANADLEDLVQEVFLQVFRSLPNFRGQAKFSTWLHRVAVNVVLMTRRRARSRPTYTHEDAGRHESDDSLLPEQRVIRSRRMEAFARLLDRLSDKKRTVFILHEIEGKPPAEIAQIVDCPVLTVRTRLFYARKELALMMKSEPSLGALAKATSVDQSQDATKTRRHTKTIGATEPHPEEP